MKEMTLKEYMTEAEKRFGKNRLDWKFICPRCKTVQSARDFKEAGASQDLTESYIGFSCIGRITPPEKKIGCDWTLGGLFLIHDLEIVKEDGTFILGFLEEGTYEVVVEDSDDPVKTYTTSAVVSVGESTVLDDITL